MSDEAREAQADENQKLAESEEQITKPAPKVKPQREKDPKKVAAGKKLGMIGAIASFVFKTAGEAVGFLAKNAWLLILAAVMFMIEKFKKK